MKCSRFFSAAVMAALFSTGIALSVAPAGPAVAESKGPTARPEVGKPVQDALTLVKQGKLREALAQIQAAEGVGNKTAYENYIVDVAKLQYYVAAKDSANSIKTAEALLASGQLGPEATVAYLQLIATEYVQSGDCPKAVDAINRYYKSGGTNGEFRRSVVACYYKQNNLRGAADALSAIIKGEAKPPEDDLKNLMGLEYKVDPTGPGYFNALKQLAATYPSTGYWHDLILYVTKKPGYSDKLELDVDQLKIATKVFSTPEEYTGAEELAIQRGLPGLAKQISDAGYAAGVLGTGPGAARQKKLADTAAAQSASDQRTLAGEAASAKSGSELLQVGDDFAGYGQYAEAINAYQKAIQAGTFKTPLEANQVKLHLGLAYLNSGQKPKAKDALKSVTGADGTADLAQLWITQAGL